MKLRAQSNTAERRDRVKKRKKKMTVVGMKERNWETEKEFRRTRKRGGTKIN
jgi:hypothetical protein